MEIRRATAADAAVLAQLNRHVHELHVAAEPRIYKPTSDEDVAAWFAGRMKAGDTAFLAFEDAEPLGYALARVMERAAHVFGHPRRYVLVDQLAVVRSTRRRGAGRALMNAAEAFARESGVDGVELDVRASNPDAIAFYTALGYRSEQLHLRREL